LIGYYFRLALRSLRRTPVMTALMVCAIGLGIGASMTMLTVLHVMTKDPIPEKSGVLFYPHLDPLPKQYPLDDERTSPANSFTWPDAMALLKAARGTHQAAMAGASLLVWPVQQAQPPAQLDGRFTTSDIFALFGIPLAHGNGWTPADDQAHARVVVLTQALADKLFGSRDPIGQSVRLDQKQVAFRVIGVIGPWAPTPVFYESPSGRANFNEQDAFFLPLATALELDFGTHSMSSWGKSDDGPTKKSPSASWLQYWVQLDTPQQVADYRQSLHDYAAQQHARGVFERGPENTRLYPLMDWLRYLRLVPDDVRLQTQLAIGLLVVCLVNIVALLLAKFLRRGGEVGVRRALGARRSDIFIQFGVEAVLIGVAGGALGIAIAELGLWSVRQRADGYARIAQMDARMLLMTALLAVAAALLAGLLPAWRASRIAPAIQIKAQ
jgi:putative ABC transport system permease protein